MSFSIAEISKARKRIEPYIFRTPVIRLKALDQYLKCEVYVKAECMQITGSFKIRGVLNKLLSLPEEELKRGIICASTGNHGKAIAYAAKLLKTKATVIVPENTPLTKVDAIRSQGARMLQCELEERYYVAAEICEETGAILISPYDDDMVMAGQGTIGMEILEDCPEIDKVVVPVSGGGLLGSLSVAIKDSSPHIKTYGAEPILIPRYTASLEAGKPVKVGAAFTVADALTTFAPGERCFPLVQKYADGVVDVEDEDILKAQKLLLREGKLLGEPSGCAGIAGVLSRKIPVEPCDKVCFVISGGNEDIRALMRLDRVLI